ncbi:MAG: hypothetical protein KIT84_43030 [Labilithrix sp.]|nr:hypothetical protein [Labilithrix sp.]MCW5817854.1 hypothetical protein [Labilithrix sp.]
MLGLVVMAGCAAFDAEEVEEPETEVSNAVSAPNPASGSLPAAWIKRATGKTLVAVAGTNAATDTKSALARGEGTAARPLERVQALEAAATVLDLTGDRARVVYAFGYGSAPTPGKKYTYRARSGRVLDVVYLGRASVSPGASPGPLSFGTEQARADAKRLQEEIDAAKLKNVLLVGHSWGGAVVDFGQQKGILTAPAISIGAPPKLHSNPLQSTRLRPDGDTAGEIFVRRRPDDPIADENVLVAIRALIDDDGLAGHDYMMARSGTPARPGGTWGLSGAGTLCSAQLGPNGC